MDRALSGLDCDLLVVGAGLGGITAALRGLELGLAVTLIEARPDIGGTALLSGGGIHIWGARDWPSYQRHCPLADPKLARPVFETYMRYVDWLVATGAPGSFGSATLRGLTLERYQIGDSIAPRAKQRWFRFLRDRILRQGGRILCDSRVVTLVRENGTVRGAVVRRGSETKSVRAGVVVLAAGGFQNDTELLACHTGLPVSRHVLRAVPEVRGDGLRLALEAGAATSGSTDTLYGHLMPAAPCRIGPGPFDFMLLSAFYAEFGVVLNSRGERFVDEGAGELTGLTINAAVRQPPGGLWVVMDEAVRAAHARYEVTPGSMLRPAWRDIRLAPYLRIRRAKRRLGVVLDSLAFARARGGTVIMAATLEALCDQLSKTGVDGEAAGDTLRLYNEAAVACAGDKLPIPRTSAMRPLVEPPYWAVKVGVGVSMTYGGVAIDASAHVLAADGSRIGGLLATPGTAGGVHQMHYAGALAACGTYGLIAAESAFRVVREQQPPERVGPNVGVAADDPRPSASSAETRHVTRA